MRLVWDPKDVPVRAGRIFVEEPPIAPSMGLTVITHVPWGDGDSWARGDSLGIAF